METQTAAKSVSGQEVRIIHFIPIQTMIGYAMIVYPDERLKRIDRRVKRFCKSCEALFSKMIKYRKIAPKIMNVKPDRKINYTDYPDESGICKKGLKASANRENFH